MDEWCVLGNNAMFKIISTLCSRSRVSSLCGELRGRKSAETAVLKRWRRKLFSRMWILDPHFQSSALLKTPIHFGSPLHHLRSSTWALHFLEWKIDLGDENSSCPIICRVRQISHINNEKKKNRITNVMLWHRKQYECHWRRLEWTVLA